MEDRRPSIEKVLAEEELQYEANQVSHDLYHDCVSDSVWKSRSDPKRSRGDMTPLALYHDSVEEAIFHLNQVYWYTVNENTVKDTEYASHTSHLHAALRRDIENMLGKLSVL